MSVRSTDAGSRSIWLIWIPSLAGVLSLMLIWKTGLSRFSGIPFLIAVAVPCYLLIIGSAGLIQRRMEEVRSAFLMGLFLAGGLVSIFTWSIDDRLFGAESENYTLPEGVELAEPEAQLKTGDPIDPFQAALKKALQQPVDNSAGFYAQVASIKSLAEEDLDRLKSILAASPAWRVFGERGAQYATRRWKTAGQWNYIIHGYYSNADMGVQEKFRTRFTIGLDGNPWTGQMGGETRVRAAELVPAGDKVSQIVVEAGPVLVECFEKTNVKERRLTKAAFQFVESEFADLPEYAAVRGTPHFSLRGTGGLYSCEIRVNPGEAGFVYVKAFEITTGEPLSPKRLREKSNERIGWSNDAEELFLSQTQFTIYEGGKGRFYGARFEVWFVPDSGAAERRLLEKNFRIEGWTRR